MQNIVTDIKTWTILFSDHLKKWMDNLERNQLIYLSKEIALLKRCGNKIKLPHSKPLGGGLFELRERHYGLRVYYTFSGKGDITLVHAGDKSSQKNNIKKAHAILKKIKINTNQQTVCNHESKEF